MKILILISIIALVKSDDFYDFSVNDYNEVKNSRNFTGKVALVTGSSSGIGEGIVKLLSILGANVVITGRNETNINRVAEEVEKLSPKKLKPLQVVADLTKEADVQRLIDVTVKQFGRLDILVNNAGSGVFTSIRDENIMKAFDNVMNIDLRPVVQLIHLSVPHLLKTNGTVISISSIAAIHPTSGFLPYNMAKAAMDMMGKVLAIELGPSIRVNTINPGYIETNFAQAVKLPFPISEAQLKMILQKTVDSTPLKRAGESLDIAKAVAFLASSDAKFITGANLIVDGGANFNMVGDFNSLIKP